MRVNARLDEEAAAQVDHRRGGWIATWAPSMMRRYASLPMDLADATLVLLAEHLGHGPSSPPTSATSRPVAGSRRSPS